MGVFYYFFYWFGKPIAGITTFGRLSRRFFSGFICFFSGMEGLFCVCMGIL
ncbi:hypothetical protein BCR42DRAFT_429589, partial [Absidia repens]